jgi:hypothetical protein
MKAMHPQRSLLVLILALALISCGSGGGGMNAGGGIDGSGFTSQGAISAIGSIVVDGAEFDTSNAAVIINGEEIGVGDAVVMDNLDIGRVVIVEGRSTGDSNTLVADRVIYSDSVQDPVESIQDINAPVKEIMVLGQKVIVNVVTLFKDTTFESIAPNDIVEVSGFPDDTGAIWATFIGKTGVFVPGLEVEVKGYVNNLDTGMKIFQINDLTVDYSLADSRRLPGGIPVDGLLVEVQGTLAAAGAEMLATEIRLADELSADDVDQIEVTGFVTDFVSSSAFTVGNLQVQSDAGTLFVDGTPANVALGVKLEVSGILSNGVLYATEIEFWEPNQIEVEGLVTRIVSLSEFTVGSQVVRTNSNTVFEGGASGNIALGVKLEVKGVPVDTARSILVADKVSFENP